MNKWAALKKNSKIQILQKIKIKKPFDQLFACNANGKVSFTIWF